MPYYTSYDKALEQFYTPAHILLNCVYMSIKSHMPYPKICNLQLRRVTATSLTPLHVIIPAFTEL